MKKVIINTKNYFDLFSMQRFIFEFEEYLKKDNIIVALSSAYFYLFDLSCNISAQDVTIKVPTNGRLSIEQLKSFNIRYCIVSHRDNVADNMSENVHIKLNKLLENDIIPILCVGHKNKDATLEEVNMVIKKQLDNYLNNISAEFIKKIIIVYEPFWAISDGMKKNITIDFENLDKIILKIRDIIFSKYKVNIMVMYGGSVNSKNVDDILKTSVDGIVIGDLSTNFEELHKLLDNNT